MLLVADEPFASALRERLAGRREVVAVTPRRASEALAAGAARFEDVVYVVGREEGSSRSGREVLVADPSLLLEVVRALAPAAALAPAWVVAPYVEDTSAAGAAPLLVPGLLGSAVAETAGLDARLVPPPARRTPPGTWPRSSTYSLRALPGLAERPALELSPWRPVRWPCPSAWSARGCTW